MWMESYFHIKGGHQDSLWEEAKGNSEMDNLNFFCIHFN